MQKLKTRNMLSKVEVNSKIVVFLENKCFCIVMCGK